MHNAIVLLKKTVLPKFTFFQKKMKIFEIQFNFTTFSEAVESFKYGFLTFFPYVESGRYPGVCRGLVTFNNEVYRPDIKGQLCFTHTKLFGQCPSLNSYLAHAYRSVL